MSELHECQIRQLSIDLGEADIHSRSGIKLPFGYLKSPGNGASVISHIRNKQHRDQLFGLGFVVASVHYEVANLLDLKLKIL
jgi:hypothetical protein